MVNNILLTGSNGFLGSYIMEEYKKFSITGLNRSKSYYSLDLSKTIPIFDESFDLVIHCAGIAHSIPINEFESKSFFDSNVNGTNNLLSGLSKITLPKQFVFISSVSVYGAFKGEKINEESPLLAEDPYGKSKIVAEDIITKWCSVNNVVCTILRLPLIVGSNPPGNLGAMINAIRKGFYFNISNGKALKSMVLATDIAKCIPMVAEIGGTFNLTDGIHPSFRELSKYIADKLGRKFVPNLSMFAANLLAIIGDKLGPKFPINSYKLIKITSTLTFDDSKARETFGWSPTPVLKGFIINE
jgi:nucleoside-diphosphate-sugar epimerase